MKENKLTPKQTAELKKNIMAYAEINPEYKKRVQEVVFNAERRNLLNKN